MSRVVWPLRAQSGNCPLEEADIQEGLNSRALRGFMRKARGIMG
jgi:hypothetical protein